MTDNLEKNLGYKFKNKGLLQQALTHGSVSSKISENYERLEFLGDRVLGLSISALLYNIFPNEPEGSLSQRFTGLVCKEAVAEVAFKIGLNHYVKVANEEIRDNESVLSDVCEALIGAIFIDSGCEKAVEFVDAHWKDLIDKNVAPPKDAKTELQEVAHNKGYGAPHYIVDGREGSEHEPIFHVSLHLDKITPETGSGRSKKIAEQDAAAKMLGRINNE